MVGFERSGRGYPLQKVTAWKSRDLDSSASCSPRTGRQILGPIMNVKYYIMQSKVFRVSWL